MISIKIRRIQLNLIYFPIFNAFSVNILDNYKNDSMKIEVTDVKPSKYEDYDPYKHRKVEHPISYVNLKFSQDT